MRTSRIIPVLAATLGLATSGCAHKLTITTNPPDARITVDGKDLGHSPATFAESPWPGEHVVSARKAGYRPVQQRIARTATNWWWVAGGLAGCALCVAPGCALGYLAGNAPTICPVVFCSGAMCGVGQTDLGIGVCLALGSLPSTIFAVPCMSGGTLLGMAPLGLLALSERSPDTIQLTLQPDPSAAPAP